MTEVRDPGRRGAGRFALLLVFVAAGVFGAGCVAPGPVRREEPPPAAPLPPPAEAPRPPSVVPPPARPEPAGIRPVRVRIGGSPQDLLLEGESLRAWSTGGALLATGSGRVRIVSVGDRIAWGSTILDSPVDVSSPGGLRLGGRGLPGRIRIASHRGKVQVVAVVPLEEYVAAVISREAAPSFLPEGLSALAVAVRTYTLVAMAAPRDPEFDVVAGVEDQVFEGLDNVGVTSRAAAEATRGEALYYREALSRTVYHSTCGGSTEDAGSAWGKDIPYLRAVPCDDCRESPVWRWEYRMSLAEGRRIADVLGVRTADDIRIEVAGRTSTGRASRIRVSSSGVSREIRAASFRQVAGYRNVRSLGMEILPVRGGWLFTGRGYGHGVGMCQWGANGMAKKGSGYRRILERYYPQTRVAFLSPGESASHGGPLRPPGETRLAGHEAGGRP